MYQIPPIRFKLPPRPAALAKPAGFWVRSGAGLALG